MTTFNRTSVFLSASVLLALSTSLVRAEVIGFNSLIGWSYNHCDAGSPPDIINPDLFQFTTGPGQCRSVWHNTPQDVSNFFVTFTYRASSISASGPRQGVTFAIQNSAAGLTALGSGGSGFGYAGITPSAAVTIETDTGPGLTYSGFYTNGILGGGSSSISPVNAFNFTDINVSMAYNGSVLTVNMVQGANVAPPKNYLVGSLSSLLGSSTAYVGFTGGTLNGANQFLSNFNYAPLPEPATAFLLLLGGVVTMRRKRHSI